MPVEEWKQKSIEIYGDIFDFSLVEWVNSRVPVILICKAKQHKHPVRPNQHLCYKRGCVPCKDLRWTRDSFIAEAIVIHGIFYNYDKVVFGNIKTPVIICCPIHGDFRQSPDHHIKRGDCCPKCSISARRDIEWVRAKSIETHGPIYDLSEAIFITMCFDKIKMICKIHGAFWQTPANHIHGKQGCPLCCINKSKKEADWLNKLGIPNDKDHRGVSIKYPGHRLVVDGFIPETNTVYEFYGDYWHGNLNVFDGDKLNSQVGKTFKELNDKVVKREELLKSDGYNIVSIWENDYDRQFSKRKQKKKKRR
jgi:G:T-mismatch repair DNA endonuclease (very short patch repair protein)